MSDEQVLTAGDVGDVTAEDAPPIEFSPVKDPLTKLLLDAAAYGDGVVIDCHISPDGMVREVTVNDDGESETHELKVPTVEFMAAPARGNTPPVCMMRNHAGGELYIDRRPTGARDDEDIALAEPGDDPLYSLMRQSAREARSIRVVPFIMPDGATPTAGIYAHIAGKDGPSVDLRRDSNGDELYPAEGVTGKHLRGTIRKPIGY